MFVTMSEFHPMYSAEWVKAMTETTIYLIRMTHNDEEFYLKEYDIKINKANWTKKLMSAHHFIKEEEATEFGALYLSGRNCDVFEQVFEMWVI